MRACASAVSAHSADDVWQVLGDFHGMPVWLPSLQRGDVEGDGGRGAVGSVRVLHRVDGTVVRERLVGHDERGRFYHYEFAGPHSFPVRAFRGTVAVRPVTAGGGSFIEWLCDFDADAADEQTAVDTFTGLYTRLIDALLAHLAG